MRFRLIWLAALLILVSILGGSEMMPGRVVRPGAPSLTPTPVQRWFGEALTPGEPYARPEVSLTLEPETTRPGGIAWVRIPGARGVAWAEVDSDIRLWGGTLHRIGVGVEGFIGIDCRVQPGSYEVRVDVGWDDGTRWSGSAMLEVLPYEFEVQHLRVSPSLQEVRSADRWAEDAPHFERARSSSHHTPLWEGSFIMPTHGRISTGFGVRRLINWVESGRHFGIDIAAPTGTPILATNSGQVTLAMELNVTGLTVFVDHGVGLFSAYYHLDRIDVEEGQMVETGQQLGTVGSTGFSTGPHLHFGVSIWHSWIDPWLVIDEQMGAR